MHDRLGRKTAEQRPSPGRGREAPADAEIAHPRLGEAHYRAIFDSASDFAIFTTDLEGVITSWNPGAEKLLGWCEAEAVGQHACMIFTPEDEARDACDREMRTADQCGRAEDERWHRRKDGLRFWASGLMMRFEDEQTGQQVGYLKVLRDRTPQHEANERLGASEARYRQIVEGAEDFAIIALDDHGVITSWNSGAERITGYTAAEAIGQPSGLIFTPEDRAAGAPDHEMNRASSDGRVPNERWHLKKDGTRFWGSGLTMRFDQRGGGYLKIFRDRTLEVQTENQLRASEEFNRRVLASSSDCIKVLDLDGRLEFMSAGGMSIMEVDDFGAVEGARWMDFWKGEEHAKALAAVEEAKRGGSGRFQGFATTMKGSPRWWDVAVTPISGSDGRPEKLLSVSRDITATKQAEESLRETSRRLDAILANTREAVFLMDHRQHCAYANAAAETLTGYTFAEMQGRPLHDVVHHKKPDGSHYPLEECPIDRAFPERAQMSGEELFVHKDGSFYPVAFTASPVLDDEGKPIGTVIEARNITEEKARDEALRESEARLRKVLGIETVGVVFFDFVGGILEANDAFLSMVGYTREDLEAGEVRYERLTPPHWRWRDEKTIAELKATGKVEPFEKEYTRKDGSRIWILCADKLLDEHIAVEFIIDVTDRRRADEALRESEARLRELNDTLETQVAERTADRDRTWRLSQDLLVVAERDGSLAAVNAAWTALLGWTEEELLGRSFVEFTHPDDLEATLSVFAGIFEGPLTTPYEYRFRHRDGSYRWFAWTATFEAGRVYATGRHTTAEHEQAEALRQAEEQLRQAQKMEAVGQLTGGIAHDFNNLLTGVIGSLDMMQRRIAKGETDKIERYTTTAITAANRAAALTHRLLAFSRRQPLDPKPVNANRLVTGMEELLRRTIGEAIRLEIVTAGGLWQTLCDPHQLESAILNLAINARDAMGEGGTITIETCNAHLDSAYAAKSRDVRPGQYICICVTDTGAGMTPDVIAKAFDPFFTTKPIGQGTGLGLSMIYGFARQSEGYAKIYSEVGKGTTVKLYLPRYYGEGEDAEETSPGLTEEHRSEHGEVVLVVEDETAVRDLVVDVLEELGYRAVQASDGPSGLKLLQSEMRIDLLVTDVGLPGLNGRQLADHARERRPGLKVLFMTGYAENATIANGFLEPGMQMITKPFAIEALATRIREMIEHG
jgi:PAS domain S-box-containing protein